MSQGPNGHKKAAPRPQHVGRGPQLGELVDTGDKVYAVIGSAANALMAVLLVADVDVDGPAKMYAMPMTNIKFDHESQTWKTPPKPSIITDLAGFFKR